MANRDILNLIDQFAGPAAAPDNLPPIDIDVEDYVISLLVANGYQGGSTSIINSLTSVHYSDNMAFPHFTFHGQVIALLCMTRMGVIPGASFANAVFGLNNAEGNEAAGQALLSALGRDALPEIGNVQFYPTYHPGTGARHPKQLSTLSFPTALRRIHQMLRYCGRIGSAIISKDNTFLANLDTIAANLNRTKYIKQLSL